MMFELRLSLYQAIGRRRLDTTSWFFCGFLAFLSEYCRATEPRLLLLLTENPEKLFDLIFTVTVLAIAWMTSSS